MGVTAELMGDPQRALELYREAASMPGVDKDDMPIYLAAKQRLTAQSPRIARAGPIARRAGTGWMNGLGRESIDPTRLQFDRTNVDRGYERLGISSLRSTTTNSRELP